MILGDTNLIVEHIKAQAKHEQIEQTNHTILENKQILPQKWPAVQF